LRTHFGTLIEGNYSKSHMGQHSWAGADLPYRPANSGDM